MVTVGSDAIFLKGLWPMQCMKGDLGHKPRVPARSRYTARRELRTALTGFFFFFCRCVKFPTCTYPNVLKLLRTTTSPARAQDTSILSAHLFHLPTLPPPSARHYTPLPRPPLSVSLSPNQTPQVETDGGARTEQSREGIGRRLLDR